MNIVEQASQQMQTLPTNMQIEALHYIEFLQQKIKTVPTNQPKIKVITAKQAKLPDINEPVETHLAFNKALQAMPVIDGFDDREIFERVDCDARDIDWSE